MRRRDFIGVLTGAVAWPLSVHAQQPVKLRRIGVLMSVASDDPEGQANIAAFLQGLAQSGWNVGENVRVDSRWAAGNPDYGRKYATELASLTPDAVLASGGSVLPPLVQAIHGVPIVFTIVADPVAGGFVDSLAHPGGTITGFTNFEYSLSGKWLELLKEIAPAVTRVAVLRDPALTASTGQFGAIQAMAAVAGVEINPINVRDSSEIERAILAFARTPNSGLIVTGSALTSVHRGLIIGLAARYKLPAVYPLPYFAAEGGLISYGPDLVDQHRRAAGYIDRILRGEKPGDLPVQAPTKYHMLINLKTAKALGLAVPATVLARADEVIE